MLVKHPQVLAFPGMHLIFSRLIESCGCFQLAQYHPLGRGSDAAERDWLVRHHQSTVLRKIVLFAKARCCACRDRTTDTFRMKFRVYYEEYTNQTEAFFMFQAIDAGGEYDVPQAKPGTPPQHRVHTVAQDFTVASTVEVHPPTPTTEVLLLRAGTHCHAPSCINETLYNMDTTPPSVVCFNAPLYGKGQWPHDGQSFDEPEYAAGVPPCYWGDAEEGLPAPPKLKLSTNLRSVKHCNSTYYHFGVMAQWQMRGTWAPEQ